MRYNKTRIDHFLKKTHPFIVDSLILQNDRIDEEERKIEK